MMKSSRLILRAFFKAIFKLNLFRKNAKNLKIYHKIDHFKYEYFKDFFYIIWYNESVNIKIGNIV